MKTKRFWVTAVVWAVLALFSARNIWSQDAQEEQRQRVVDIQDFSEVVVTAPQETIKATGYFNYFLETSGGGWYNFAVTSKPAGAPMDTSYKVMFMGTTNTLTTLVSYRSETPRRSFERPDFFLRMNGRWSEVEVRFIDIKKSNEPPRRFVTHLAVYPVNKKE